MRYLSLVSAHHNNNWTCWGSRRESHALSVKNTTRSKRFSWKKGYNMTGLCAPSSRYGTLSLNKSQTCVLHMLCTHVFCMILPNSHDYDKDPWRPSLAWISVSLFFIAEGKVRNGRLLLVCDGDKVKRGYQNWSWWALPTIPRLYQLMKKMLCQHLPLFSISSGPLILAFSKRSSFTKASRAPLYMLVLPLEFGHDKEGKKWLAWRANWL